MEKFAFFLTQNFLTKLGVAAITGLTLLTSVGGVSKVITNLDDNKTFVPELRAVQNSKETDTDSNKTVQVSKSVSSNTKTNNSVNTNTQKQSSTANKNSGSKTTASPTNSNQSTTSNPGCIITLFGNQYNIASLLTSHSGGNIFSCGTDMTALYQSRHGTNLSRMQAYLVNGNGTTGKSGKKTSGSTSATSFQRGERHENQNDDESESSDEKEQIERDIKDIKSDKLGISNDNDDRD